jgi:hypothetical protein
MLVTCAMSVGLSVHFSAWIGAASTGRISLKLHIWDFMKLFRKIRSLVKIGENCRVFKSLRTFYCCRRYKCAINHCCATLSVFILLAVARSSKIHDALLPFLATVITWKSHNGTLYVRALPVLSLLVFFLLGDSSASEFYVPTFRNSYFHLCRPCKHEE